MGLEPVMCSWTQWNTWFSFTSQFWVQKCKKSIFDEKKSISSAVFISLADLKKQQQQKKHQIKI